MNKESKAIDIIFAKIDENPLNFTFYHDAFVLITTVKSVELSKILREKLNVPLTFRDKKTKKPLINIKDFLNLRNDALLFEAPYDFDSYCRYLEIKRPLEEQFYMPRRKTLKSVVDLLQQLADGKLDEIFVSMPPRVGKTTILLFFITWVMGRESEVANLYSAYSDTITKRFYDRVNTILDDPNTYTWHDIFPNVQIANTNAQDETIDIDRRKDYPSLTCRSIKGTLNGACDCSGFLIADDLISGIEEAMNKDRLNNVWAKVDNDLLPRTKHSTKIIWVGTRWSLQDPIGVRLDLLENDPRFETTRWKNLNLPALNDKEESNFNYRYDKGFSTDDYLKRRASFKKNNDNASWLALYMGEPIEREGTLFVPQDLKFFNGHLPGDNPDRIFMVVDVAFGGGDFLSAPVCFQYGDDIYIRDWVFSSGDKSITRPEIVAMIKRYGVEAINFEKNNGGGEYKDFIADDLRSIGYKCNITTSSAPNTKRKETRIFDHAPEIREFYFLQDSIRNKEYSLAMQNLYSFKMNGKNRNDDAPDSLAQVCEFNLNSKKNKFSIFKRPF